MLETGLVANTIHVVGAGLAGSEAAWQIARAGLDVRLYEMRPAKSTPAHKTGGFAELVCSNSLKSESPNTAPWLLKNELRQLGSMVLEAADASRVPGGHALTVDRDLFSASVTQRVSENPLIEIIRDEVIRIPADDVVVIATGPLTSDALAEEIARITGSG